MTLKLLSIVCIFFLWSTEALSQETPLFIIVSCSEGVLLDDKPVSPGKTVFASSRKLTVPKRGYVGVITSEGLAYELTSSIATKRIIHKIHGKSISPRFNFAGGTHFSLAEMEIIGGFNNSDSNFFGDSLFFGVLHRSNKKKEPPYYFYLKNILDKEILRDSTFTNWKAVGINIGNKEKALIFEIGDKRTLGKSEQFLLHRVSSDDGFKIKNDLGRISDEGVGSKIMQIAVYEINHFYHDQLFTLYQIVKNRNEIDNVIFNAYINYLRKKYRFDQFNFAEEINSKSSK